MSTHRAIDRICAIAIAVAIVFSCLLWSMSPGSMSVAHAMGYERTLFDTSRVHTIDIVMDDWAAFIAGCENEEYADCTVVIDGEAMKNVAIRAKGNTSLSNVRSLGSQRYSFKLEFDHNQKGRTYHGLDKLCLNNLIQDNTMMKDFLAYQMMAQFGVDAPLCSYVYIRVNGEDWGLYLAVEGVEDSFLARNYGSKEGDLYKPDSMSFGGGRGNGREFNMDDFDFSSFTEAQGKIGQDNQPTMPGGFQMPSQGMPGGDFQMQGQGGFGGFQMPNPGGMPGGDFTPPDQGNMPDGQGKPEGSFQPDEVFPGGGFGGSPGGFGFGSGDVKLQYSDDDPASYANIFSNAKTNVTEKDRQRLIASLKQLNEGTNIESVVDVDEVLRYFVVHNFIRNGDSYTGAMIHNYYLYEENGQLSMIPWDYNLGFGTFQGGNASSEVNADIDQPVAGGSVSDRPMVAWIFADEAYTQRYHELMAAFIDQWFTSGKMADTIASLQAMLTPYLEKDPTKFCTMEEYEKGVEAIASFVTLRAESISNQLNGSDTKVDCGDLNLSDMGTMSGMGGRPGGDIPQMSGGNPFEQGDNASSGNPQMPSGTPFEQGGNFSFGTQQMPGGNPFDQSGNAFSGSQMPGSNPFGTSQQIPEGNPFEQTENAPAVPAKSEAPTEQPAAQRSAPIENMQSSRPDSTLLLCITATILAIGLAAAAFYKPRRH